MYVYLESRVSSTCDSLVLLLKRSHMNIHMCAYLYVSVNVYMYVCAYVECMYACMCIHIYIEGHVSSTHRLSSFAVDEVLNVYTYMSIYIYVYMPRI